MFFTASVVVSFTLKTTGEAINLAIVDTATFVGAHLLLPASEHVERT